MLRSWLNIPMLAMAACLSLSVGGTSAQAQTAQAKTHLLGKASGLVQLRLPVISPGQTLGFNAVNPDGSDGGAFALPPKTVLVVTDVHVVRTATDGIYEGRILNQTASTDRVRFLFDSSQHPSYHLGVTSGIVFTDAPRVFLFATSAGAAAVWLEGYLAKDK